MYHALFVVFLGMKMVRLEKMDLTNAWNFDFNIRWRPFSLPIETFRNCVCELHMERKLLSLCQWTSRCEDANARAETNLSILIDYRIYFIL